MWTITHNGEEKILADWGLSDLQRSRFNLGVDTITFFAGGRAVDADELFPYASTIIVQRDRSRNGDVFTGGNRWFYGRIEPWDRSGDARTEDHAGACVGPMWYLANRVFRQTFQAWNGWTTPDDPSTPPTFVPKTLNHIFLNQAADGTKLTWREQVIEAVQWSINCGDPIAIGNITPDIPVPIDEVKNITCAQVLQQLYRWCLDAVFWFDYSTLPYPTLHCKRHAELTPVAIALNAGDLIEKIRIKERPDWKRPYVLLQFEQEINGVLNTIEDKWPDPIPSGPPPGGLETTVDLKGWSITRLEQRVSTAGFDITNVDWWKSKLGWLNSGEIAVDGITILEDGEDAPTLKARDGSAWNVNLPRELVPGSVVAPWMTGIGSQKVRALARVDIVLKNLSTKTRVEIHHDFTVTNAISKTYFTDEVTQVGDPVPFGLAREMWTAYQALSCEGNIVLADDEVPDVLDMDNLLNFTTPNQTEWADLKALIQRIDENATSGRVSISFGAPEHLDARELVELLRVARNRFNPTSLALRSTGMTGSGSAAQLPDQGGDGNSTSGAGHYKRFVVSGDPDEGGNVKKVNLNSEDIIGAPDTEVKVRDWSPVLGLPGGTVQVPSSSVPLALGGSAVKMFKVTAVPDDKDYFFGVEFDGVTEGAEVPIAKHPKNRPSFVSETLDGVDLDYEYDDANNRSASDGTKTQVEVLYFRLQVGDIIFAAQSSNGTGVAIGGAPVRWIEMTARLWSRRYTQPSV